MEKIKLNHVQLPVRTTGISACDCVIMFFRACSRLSDSADEGDLAESGREKGEVKTMLTGSPALSLFLPDPARH